MENTEASLSERGNLKFPWKTQLCHVTFFRSCLVRGCFAETGMWEDVLMAQTCGDFIDCLVKGHVVFCWTRYFRGHTMFRKNRSIARQTMRGRSWIGSLCKLCWSSLIFACHNFTERDEPENFWWYSGCFFLLPWTYTDSAEPWGFFWIELLLLIHVWCLLPGWDCHDWLIFDVLDWNADILSTKIRITPKNYF